MLDKKKLNFILNSTTSLEETMSNPMVDPDFFADSFANSYFPVLEGTPHEKEGYSIPKEWLLIYESFKNKIQKYEENCDYMLQRNLTKDMFHDNSLFLIKESLKTFSSFSDKAKSLLEKLENL